MNDLIRRKDVIKLVNRFVFGLCKEQNDEARKEFIKHIEKIPTAYDIDKVVEELERAKHEICLSGDDLECYQNGIDTAIEIVKQSGVSDDVCEWHKVKNSNTYKCNTHAEIHDSRVLDWKLCPYCGKKILCKE